MPNLRSYTREALLALPAGAELDELVHEIILGPMEDKLGVIQAIFPCGYYSRQNKDVGGMLVKLREYWPYYAFGPLGRSIFAITSDRTIPSITGAATVIESTEAPHVCALALCLAAWEKERQQ